MSNFGLLGFTKTKNLSQPNFATQDGVGKGIVPPEWMSYRLITATTSNEVAPQDVHQILAMVWGGGGSGVVGSKSGGGGGFSMGIIDVVPGQLLPTITVGGAGGASSFGALLTSTGAINQTAGSGFANVNLRSSYTAPGGLGAVGNGRNSGAASGSPYGAGGNANTSTDKGGSAWGGEIANSAQGASMLLSNSNSTTDTFLNIANGRALQGNGAKSSTETPGAGCGGYFGSGVGAISPSLGGGGGGSPTGTPGNGGLAGGGGGGSNSGNFGVGGPGLVVIYWTYGY